MDKKRYPDGGTMTTPATDFANMLKTNGVPLDDEVRDWPIEWIVYRMQVNPHWPAIEHLRHRLRMGEQLEPIILCRKDFVPLDGCHRLAAYWLEGRRTVRVRFADMHFYQQAPGDYCRTDLAPGLDWVRAWAQMPCVSGAYDVHDIDYPLFGHVYQALQEFGGSPPNVPTRLWERTRAAIFGVGWPPRKKVLDVGTRESLLPHWLAAHGAQVFACDLHPEQIKNDGTVAIQYADACNLPFDNDQFDATLCTSCIKFIPDDSQAMRELVRVTKPGGYIAVTVDFWTQYREFPSAETGRRVYDRQAICTRLLLPSMATLCGPVDFDRADWSTKPLMPDTSIQVAAVILRKT